MAVLFAIGSVLFALGAVPGFASAAGVRGESITFFVGSLFFGVSALASYIVPTTGQLFNVTLTNLGTFVGALLFLAGAALLLPERTEAVAS